MTTMCCSLLHLKGFWKETPPPTVVLCGEWDQDYTLQAAFLPFSQGVVQDALGHLLLLTFTLALFLVTIPHFPGSILFDILCWCEASFPSVGGVSHEECLQTHLL